jgi:hypothetical protein
VQFLADRPVDKKTQFSLSYIFFVVKSYNHVNGQDEEQQYGQAGQGGTHLVFLRNFPAVQFFKTVCWGGFPNPY